MERKSTRRGFVKVAGAVGLSSLAGCSQSGGGSGEFPNESIRHIIPWAEGGGSDTYSRNVLGPLSDVMDTPVEFDNVSGGGGLQGTGELHSSDSDGHTIGMMGQTELVATYQNEVDFDMADLKGVAIVGRSMYVAITHEDYDISGYEDLVSRFQSGEFEDVGVVAGSQSEFFVPDLLEETGLEHNMVSYDGSGPVNQAVLSKEVPVGIPSDSGAVSAVQDAAEVVAVTGDIGSEVFPDAPSLVADLGYDPVGPLVQLDKGIWAPPETPDERVQALADGIEECTQDDEVQNWSEESGNPVVFEGPEGTTEMLQGAIESAEEDYDLG